MLRVSLQLRQAHSTWEALKADKSVDRDEGGPPGSRLRLAIPSWLVGKDVLEQRDSTFVEHELTQSSNLIGCEVWRLEFRISQ